MTKWEEGLKTLKRVGRQVATSRVAIIGLLINHGAVAQGVMPTVAPPTRGAATTNYIKTAQDYAYDIFIFAGLILGTLAFIHVVRNTMATYSQVPENRATMGDVGVQAGVGVLILVFVVFLLTEAAKIL